MRAPHRLVASLGLAPIAVRGRRWQSAAIDTYTAYLDTLNGDAHAATHITVRGEALVFIAQDVRTAHPTKATSR